MSHSRIKLRPQKKSKPRGPRYWLAVGTLAAYTTFGNEAAIRAHAQAHKPSKAASSSSSSSPTSDLLVRRFEISAGNLGEVLPAFEQTAGLTVSLADESIRAVWSPGVVGVFSPQAALQKILVGTGIGYRFTGKTTVRLQIQGPSVAVEVNDTALQDTLPAYTQPLVETPQSIDVVPQRIIQDQGATTLRDTLRNVAGISLAAGEGGAQGDNLTIRGFTARNDIFLDGMRDFGSYYRDPFNLSEVQVLQGPSGVVFGRGSTGGVVNQQTKSPDLNGVMAATLDLGTDQTRRVTMDYDKPLPAAGEGTAFRLNLMAHDSKLAGRDVGENRRFGIAPSLAFGLGTPTSWTLSYLHAGADDTPDYGIPFLFNGPAPVARRNYYGFQHGNYLKTNVDMGTVKFEHAFGNSVVFRNQIRYAHYHRDVRVTEAQVDTATLLPAPQQLLTPLAQIGILRNQITVNSLETFLQDQTDVTLRFRTAGLPHTLVAGAEGGRETSSPYRPRYNIQSVPKTSLLHPDPKQAFAGDIISTTSDTNVLAISGGAYILDTISLAPRWDLTGGVRVDRFDASLTQSLPPGSPSLNRTDVMPSYRAALVFKPAAGASLYFDYGTSFNPSAEALSLTVASSQDQVAPESNRTLEAGAKWDMLARKLSFRASLFRTDKTNARETLNDGSVENSGNYRVNGFQFQTSGYLTPRWELLASYAYLDGRVTKTSIVPPAGLPSALGAQLANVPRNSFSTWSNYDLPWKLTLGAGADFVDSRTASATQPYDPLSRQVKRVPGYWVFNAMVKYPLSEHLELRLNVYNLADRYYIDQVHPAHLVPGAARSALLDIHYKF
jgi:catecholate siderophore receptor